MPHLNEHHATWIGRTLTDASGHRIGKIDDIYTDDDTGQPEWLAVSGGLMGPHTHFVPMRGATSSGGVVQVPFPKGKVKLAPSAGADGRLSRMEKGRLYAHYGYSYAEERNRMQRSLGFDRPGPTRPADGHEVGRAVELHGMAGLAEVRQLSLPSAARGEADGPPPAHRGQVEGPPPADRSQADGPPPPDHSHAEGPPPPDHSHVAGSPLADRSHADGPPPAHRGVGRGRWPDDEAIFGLAQAAAHPRVPAGGASRRR